jgi:hypothetical protein
MMKIFIDSDGFFWPADIEPEYMSIQRQLISIEKEQGSFIELFEQYYLGFRSAMFICEDSIESESEAEVALREWREGCIHSAMSYMESHIKSEISLPVDFMWIVREAIVSVLKEEFPEVGSIKLRLSMKPRLSARSAGENIIFPALIRTVLNHCNLVIINSVFQVMNEEGQLVGEVDNKQNARFIFPYLLYCHDDFSVRNLPIIGAHSENALQTALLFSNIQMIYIFSHEYAHILLQHFDDNRSILDKENEADAFALNVVLTYIEKDSTYSKQDVLAAIRWLFKYQLIEESIGTLVRGKSLDFFESEFEKRRGDFQSELFLKHDLKGSTLFESIGFCMIVELQAILYEFGPKLINEIIDAFNKSEKTGGIEPWWEKITQK